MGRRTTEDAGDSFEATSVSIASVIEDDRIRTERLIMDLECSPLRTSEAHRAHVEAYLGALRHSLDIYTRLLRDVKSGESAS